MLFYKFAHPQGAVKVYREKGGETKLVMMGVKREVFCSILVTRVCNLLSEYYHKEFTLLRLEIANWNTNAQIGRKIDLHDLHSRLRLLPSVESSFEPEITPGIEVKVHLEIDDVIMFRVFHTGTVNSHKACTIASMLEAWVCIREAVLLDDFNTITDHDDATSVPRSPTVTTLTPKLPTIVHDTPICTPIGTPIGTPSGTPSGTPICTPSGTPIGTPICTPICTPIGTPIGTPNLEVETPGGSPAPGEGWLGPLAYCSTATLFECVWD